MAINLPKGIRCNNGNLQIRLSNNGKQFSLSKLGDCDNANNTSRAIDILNDIKKDILNNRFIATNNEELRAIYNPSQEIRAQVIAKSVAQRKEKSILQIWDAWVATLGLQPSTAIVHYADIRKMLVRHGGLNSALSARTYNDRLSYINKAMQWGVEEGYIKINPFCNLKKKKRDITDQHRKAAREAFSRDEIDKIMDALEGSARDFMMIMLHTGCRNSEVIGLRMQDIDLDNRTIYIGNSLSADRVNGGRKRKTTKSGSIRILPIASSLMPIFERLCICKNADDLLLQNANGKPFDDKNFLNRHWKPALERLGIRYRVPYALRHTFASHALLANQGDYHAVASLLGHSSPKMLLQNYGHQINKGILPF